MDRPEALNALSTDQARRLRDVVQEVTADRRVSAIVLCSAVPSAFCVGADLKERGRLVAVEGYGNAGVARIYLKDNGLVTGRRAFNAAIPPLPGFEKPGMFEF